MVKNKQSSESGFQAHINDMDFKHRPTALDIEFLKSMTFDELLAYDFSTVSKDKLKAFHDYLAFETKKPIPRSLVAAIK